MGTLVILEVPIPEMGESGQCDFKELYRRGLYVRHVVFSLICPLKATIYIRELTPLLVLKWILASPVEAPSQMNNTYFTANRPPSTQHPCYQTTTPLVLMVFYKARNTLYMGRQIGIGAYSNKAE